MGPSNSKPLTGPPSPRTTKTSAWRSSLRDKRQNLKTSFGYISTSSITDDVPTDNIFTPIQADSILPQIPIGRHHPVPRTGVEDDEMRTLHTNSFYANAFLGQQNQPVWTHPYVLCWGKGWVEPLGLVQTWGMNVSCFEEGDAVFEGGNPAKSYTYPSHEQSLILTAKELDVTTTLTTDTHLPFSVNINLNALATPHEPKITFPVVQGMCFVTAGYRDATPVIQTGGRGFAEVVGPFMLGRLSMKYRIKDKNGRCWVIYINPILGLDYDITRFKRLDSNTLIGPPGFKGTIQVAKNPLGAEGEALYDRACGAFVSEATITAVAPDGKGAYSFRYTKIGTSPLLMFILPHHLASLDPTLKPQVTNLRLQTTTKGTATAIWGQKLTFLEPNLPMTMHFGPWNPNTSSSPPKIRYPPEVLALLSAVADRDLRRSMTQRTTHESLYFAGKSLSKFATILWVLKDVLGHDTLATTGLDKLKEELALYIQNQQQSPLYYDDSWKGVVSSAGFSSASPADPPATTDFANTYYTDHHTHYAYFVFAASIIAYLDPAWLSQGDNHAWTNMLVKDYAESAYQGRDYPFFRAFDWWHGHSWSDGLGGGPGRGAPEGKSVRSVSEDAFASFAVKMWGRVSGDADMEKRGNLMLAIQARTSTSYFYLQTTNTNHPARFLQNKIAGLLFENRVEYGSTSPLSPLSPPSQPTKQKTHTANLTTPHPSLIHMIPLLPSTAYIRPRAFVKEEWDTFFAGGEEDIQGGWRGILYANLALIDASASFSFFRDGVDGFWDERWIDGGASRAFYLVWASALWEFGK
ncbi:endo-1,3(4)-beta-glucanase 1 precursor [Decorospora gaudefroyi]|uniref:glucan endo-1,3-beta-D-glucosidase n=1 Tax=Decorospora gaudefroyi TaxID=184978 RepID=A0A6A5KFY5_9PLEO|nr:endo-1,3(4)-beta-glucanase 1 precursor [Decorospora gaudefroyi]